MATFSMADMVIIGLILFLSWKGFINGLFRELVVVGGFVVGIYFGSRVNREVGELINNNLLHIQNESTIKYLGFLLFFLLVWMISIYISHLIGKFSNEITIFSRISGYVVSIFRYIVIFAVIIASLQTVEFITKKMAVYSKGSKIVPKLDDIGRVLLNMDKRFPSNEPSKASSVGQERE